MGGHVVPTGDDLLDGLQQNFAAPTPPDESDAESAASGKTWLRDRSPQPDVDASFEDGPEEQQGRPLDVDWERVLQLSSCLPSWCVDKTADHDWKDIGFHKQHAARIVRDEAMTRRQWKVGITESKPSVRFDDPQIGYSLSSYSLAILLGALPLPLIHPFYACPTPPACCH